MPVVSAATCHVLSTGSPVDDGYRLVSYDTSLVVSGGVDCGEDDEMFMTRSLDVTPKTAHLTARSDKSVAYVTNNKRLYSTFCTVEDRYESSCGLFATAELLVYLRHQCVPLKTD